MKLPFSTYDVFTGTPFKGNPLAIVEEADGLTTEQMQTIAREFNLSETIFVQSPADAGHTAKVRIFFPTADIPFAGHPTIGCALHLAAKRGLDHIILEEEAGLVPVTLQDGHAEFVAPVVPHATGRAVDAAQCAAAIGLPDDAIGPHAPGVFTGGPAFLYIPVRSAEHLAAARPMEPGWSDLMEAGGVDSAYLYTPGFEARMFSPTAGIPEDPATGSASAILAAQLLANGALAEGTTTLTLHQGRDMGRLSEVHFTAEVAGGALREVRIAGHAVPISTGEITIP